MKKTGFLKQEEATIKARHNACPACSLYLGVEKVLPVLFQGMLQKGCFANMLESLKRKNRFNDSA